MSEEIHWLLVVEIFPGQIENFCVLATDLIAATKLEPDTLNYEWNLSADGTSCHIYERCRDSTALVTHVQGFHKFAERFLQSCRPVRFDVYGSPSEEARAAVADLQPIYYTYLGGFGR